MIGAETEWFVLGNDSKGNQVVFRARGLTEGCDSNDSIAELRTSPVKTGDYKALAEEVIKQLKKNAYSVIQNIGAKGMDLEFHLTPYVEVPIQYSKDIVFQMKKTAGVHCHLSDDESLTEIHRNIIARRWQMLYKQLNELNQKRIKSPVIGPQSGTVYRYGAVNGLWRRKDSSNNHWEFRGFPASEIIVDERLLELAYRFCMPTNSPLNDIEMRMLLSGLNSHPVFKVSDLLDEYTNKIHIYKVPRITDERILLEYSREVIVKSKFKGDYMLIETMDDLQADIIRNMGRGNREYNVFPVNTNKIPNIISQLEKGTLAKEFIHIGGKQDFSNFHSHTRPYLYEERGSNGGTLSDFARSSLTNIPEYREFKNKCGANYNSKLYDGKILMAYGFIEGANN